jgi:serine/threonine protein kinase
MVTGQLPWTKRNQAQLFAQIRRGEYAIPSYLSPECADLIQRLMAVDIHQRITVKEAVKHPFLADVNLVPTGTKATRLVSLKKLDLFFGKDEAFDMKEVYSVLARHKSEVCLSIEKIVDRISQADTKLKRPIPAGRKVMLIGGTKRPGEDSRLSLANPKARTNPRPMRPGLLSRGSASGYPKLSLLPESNWGEVAKEKGPGGADIIQARASVILGRKEGRQSLGLELIRGRTPTFEDKTVVKKGGRIPTHPSLRNVTGS